MTNRDRLIELIVNADTYDSYECKLCAKDDDACDCCYAEKLADHLLANGVIAPPCKVGDTVYQMCKIIPEKPLKNPKYWVWTVLEVFVSTKEQVIEINKWWNEYYFATKEEAKRALKEREQNAQ